MAWNKIDNLAALSLALIFAACGGDDAGNKSVSPDLPSREVFSLYELGICTADFEGDTVFVIELNTDYLCTNNNWVNLTTIQSSSNTVALSSSEMKLIASSSSFAAENSKLSSSSKENSSSSYSIITSSSNFVSSSSSNSFCLEVKERGNLGGKCNSTNVGQCALALADSSYHVCKTKGWEIVSKNNIDTLRWGKGDDGEIRKGNVTETYYIFKNGIWAIAQKETALGLCTIAREGELGHYFEYEQKYVICENDSWREATVLEYDTYGWNSGFEGEMRPGSVESTNHYVYVNKAWRKTADNIEYEFGACVVSRENEKHSSKGLYYICESTKWKQITFDVYVLGYCTAAKEGQIESLEQSYRICENGSWKEMSVQNYEFGSCSKLNEGKVELLNGTCYICEPTDWIETPFSKCDTHGLTCGKEGLIVDGLYEPTNKYVCDGGVFRIAGESELSINLGCTSYNEGDVKKKDNDYYICKSGDWIVAAILEYDTYGVDCSKDGVVINGKIFKDNKYVCDADSFRVANEKEISLSKGCVNYTEHHVLRKKVSEEIDSIYICQNGQWDASVGKSIYGSLLDERNNRVYKIVAIGEQIWMAENLNYAYRENENTYNRSWCYEDKEENCDKYGRLYSWTAAIDSITLYNNQGVTCGIGANNCQLPSKVQGICPNGWHLPSHDEWLALINAIDPYYMAGKIFKTQTEWSYGNGIDSVGFSALPAGYRFYFKGTYKSIGTEAYFIASTSGGTHINVMHLTGSSDSAIMDFGDLREGYSVRCIKD